MRPGPRCDPSSRARSRTAWLTVALTGAIIASVGCTSDAADEDPDPTPAAEELAEALTSGDLSSVTFTNRAEKPQVALDDIVAGVADLEHETVVSGVVAGDGSDATANLHWTWTVADQEWAYDTQAQLTLVGAEWRVHWDPEIVEPTLRDGVLLDAVAENARRGDILGAGGARLVTERPVFRVGVDRSRVPAKRAGASARALAGLVGIDVPAYVARVEAAGEKAFVEAIVYRKGQLPLAVARGYPAIKGVIALNDRIPLAPSATFAAEILGRVGEVTAEMIEDDPSLSPGDVVGLSGLEARYEDLLAGTSGTRVDAVATDGKHRVLFSTGGGPGEPLRVSLDLRLQEEAERALAALTSAAGLVAIRPSTGEILAAANGAGNGGVNLATYGQAAPGSTFKIVTSLALLRAGLTPDSPVSCQPSVVIDGKVFTNYDDYPAGGIGQIPLRTALANSCNTAFIAAGERLGDEALADAAASLGVGIDHDVGFPAYFGQVDPPASRTAAAADRIGQGTVLASPMSMATVMASVVAGRTVVPTLVDPEQVDTVDVEVPDGVAPLTPAEAGALRGMLRGVVTAGSGSILADVPGAEVIAKTGTAEFDRNGQRLTHAWMVAGQGDLAVAVYVDEGVSGSRTAGPVLEQFLRAAAAG